MARLYDKGYEGVSDLMNKIVETHQLALQANCRLLIEYGVEGVDIQQVFQVADDENQDWTVPPNYNCNQDPTCFAPKTIFSLSSRLSELVKKTNHSILMVPQYRMAYQGSLHALHKDSFQELRQKWPGYSLETSMACSLQSLLRLAPSASLYEPCLFTKLLPTLHQPDSLVLSLYILTGHADQLARQEDGTLPKENNNATSVNLYERQVKHVVSCAQHLEQEYLKNDVNNQYTNIVWMLVTDSPQQLKESISQMYSTSNQTVLTRHRGEFIHVCCDNLPCMM